MISKGDGGGALFLCWIFGPIEMWFKMSLFINGFDYFCFFVSNGK